MTTFDLGNGKQIVLGPGRIVIWANQGSLGVELTPEMEKEVGLAMWQNGRRAKTK